LNPKVFLQQCKDWYEQEYSAGKMKLVVLRKELPNQLEEWVRVLFSGVRNKELPENGCGNEEPQADSIVFRISDKLSPLYGWSIRLLYFPMPLA
jgi:secreted Zn-dependent insulinase-like peptidase